MPAAERLARGVDRGLGVDLGRGSAPGCVARAASGEAAVLASGAVAAFGAVGVGAGTPRARSSNEAGSSEMPLSSLGLSESGGSAWPRTEICSTSGRPVRS